MSAHKNPLIWKPGIIHSTSKAKSALITSKNNPKVRIVIGKVNMTSNGLMKMLTTPKISAAKNACQTLSTPIPGKT